MLPVAGNDGWKTINLGLGRVRFCVPGDVGCSEFSVSFIRSGSSSRVVRNSTTSRKLRAPTATSLPNMHHDHPARHRSPDFVSEAMATSLRMNGSTGRSSNPLAGVELRDLPWLDAGLIPRLRAVDSKVSPVVDAVFFPGGDGFRSDDWHSGVLRIVCGDSVAGWKPTMTTIVVRRGLPFHGLPRASWQSRRLTDALRSSADPRTCPQIRVSNEEGNVDQCPPTGGKSNCHR